MVAVIIAIRKIWELEEDSWSRIWKWRTTNSDARFYSPWKIDGRLNVLWRVIVTTHKISEHGGDSRPSLEIYPVSLASVRSSELCEGRRAYQAGIKGELRRPLYCSGATLCCYPTARQTKAGRMTLPKRLHNSIPPSAIVQRPTSVVRKHEPRDLDVFFSYICRRKITVGPGSFEAVGKG